MKEISKLSLIKIVLSLPIIAFGLIYAPEAARSAKPENFFIVTAPRVGKIKRLRTVRGVVAGKNKGKKVVALSKDLAPLNKSLKKAQKKNKTAKISQICSKIAALNSRISTIQAACIANDPLNPPGPSSSPSTNPPNFNEPVPSEDPSDVLSLDQLDRPVPGEDVCYLFEKAGFGFSAQEWPMVAVRINGGVFVLVDAFMTRQTESQ